MCGCDMIFAVAAAARGDNGLLDLGPAHINHTTRDIARRLVLEKVPSEGS